MSKSVSPTSKSVGTAEPISKRSIVADVATTGIPMHNWDVYRTIAELTEDSIRNA